MLKAAWSSYVASLNPSPLMGSATPEATRAVATLALNRAMVQAHVSPATRAEIQTQLQLVTAVQPATQTATQTQTKTATQPATATQTKTQTATQTATKTKTQTASQSALKTATQTQTATRTAAKTLAKTIAKTMTQAKTLTNVMTDTSTLDIPEPEWPKHKAKPAKDEDMPEVLPENKGAVAWKQGAMFGKPVINVLRKPFKTSNDLKTTVGQVPAGVTLVSGKGSANRSAVLLSKPGPRDVTIDSGFQDLNIRTSGNRVTLTYHPDPKGLTRHEIRVGQKRPPSQKRPRVTLSPSKRVGKQFFTPMGSSTAISRRPLGKRSKGR